MFLRHKIRRKDGKEHRAWSVVENRRVQGGRVVQRQVLYLGEINDSQRAGWSRAIEAFDEGGRSTQIALFPEDRTAPVLDCDVVSIRLSQMRLRRPRQWGACWLAMVVWGQLRLDEFWEKALPPSREGTSWLNILKTLASYQLISPGSEWRLHRQWFAQSAMGDLLGEDVGLVQPNNLYRCLDKLTTHKPALFTFLRRRWKDLFGAEFDVLLYDLTSTYFESDPPDEGKRQFGYSRDKRSDCVQVVIALIVTPDGFPLAYEVMDGNTSDKTTLKAFLAKIEALYGAAKRAWVMDRGIPTEEALAEMRASSTPIRYFVGTPRGRLTRLEKALAAKPWEEVRESVRVKLVEDGEETYVLGAQRSPAREGTGDAPPSPAQVDQPPAPTPAARPDARRVVARTRRGQEASRPGLRPADDPYADKGSTGHAANLPFRARPLETPRGAAARGPLSLALQHQRRRPRAPVAGLSAIGRNRAGVQGTEERFFRFAPSITNSNRASKPTFSWPSSPIA